MLMQLAIFSAFEIVVAICDIFLDPWQLILKFYKRDLHFGVFFHECMVKSTPGLCRMEQSATTPI
jgi:hypothetical protein